MHLLLRLAHPVLISPAHRSLLAPDLAKAERTLAHLLQTLLLRVACEKLNSRGRLAVRTALRLLAALLSVYEHTDLPSIHCILPGRREVDKVPWELPVGPMWALAAMWGYLCIRFYACKGFDMRSVNS